MLVTLLGMVKDVKLLQLEKAFFPMLVTLLGIATDVKPLQSLKHSCGMLVMEPRLLTVCIFVPMNAFFPNVVRLGRFRSVITRLLQS